MESEPTSLFLLFILLLPRISSAGTKSGDAVALLALKAAVDRQDSLPWRPEAADGMCGKWSGVKGCSPGGRVTKLVLEFLNLTGTMGAELLAPLDQLRVLSLKSNALYGGIPDLSPLFNLKSLYLGGNRFSGRIPVSLAGLHRLKIVAFEGNRLSGPIPASFANIPRLYMLLLQDNTLSGFIPAFNQPGLRYFNVSGNGLSGEIPATRALAQFNASSFLNNPELCGRQVEKPCTDDLILPPSAGSKHAPSPVADFVIPPAPVSTRRKSKRVVRIVAGAVAGGVFLLICLLLAVLLFCRRKMKTFEENRPRSVAKSAGAEVSSSETGGGGGVKGWEGQEGRLEFCGGAGEMYGLEELLRASAETMGRGTVGSTYKAVMETGFIVTVKRLREATPPCAAEFRRRMEELGRLRHPNLVPLRAYFQAKEERLLVFDYFPNGSLFSLIHGSRHSGSGKPLHWTSCLKIAEDVATGLLYLHQSGTIHGNLKSSNVLLGSDFESCLTDYSLIPYLHCTTDDSTSSSSTTTTTTPALFYRAPESRNPHKPAFTPQSDVYSFGVLLLELLTGKTPFHDLVERHCADIPRWVRSVREEESIDDPTSGNETSSSSEEKLAALIGIATACVSMAAEGRPTAKEVLRMVRETRAEALVSSNSSDHSPARWSDTVQSLPREYGSEHLNFAERD